MTIKPSTAFDTAWSFNTFAGGATNATSVTAELWRNGAVDSGVTVTVTNPSTGNYKFAGSTGAYSDGDKVQLFAVPVNGGITYRELVWTATIDSSFAAEVKVDTAAVKAKTDNLPTDPADQSAVEAAITAATSPLATASALSTVAGYVDTEVAAIKAKTDNLPADPADASDIAAAFAAVPAAVWAYSTRTLSSFGTLVADVATAVWAAVTRTLTSGAAPSAAQNATAVWAAVAADNNTALSMGEKLNAAGAAADPMLNTPSGYAAGTLGQLIGKLNVGEADETVIPIPAAPVDTSLCHVYAYVENAANAAASGVAFVFTLQTPGAIASERVLAGRTVRASTNAAGLLSVYLHRNDGLTPSGSRWQVVCQAAKLNTTIELAAETYDLKTLIV